MAMSEQYAILFPRRVKVIVGIASRIFGVKWYNGVDKDCIYTLDEVMALHQTYMSARGASASSTDAIYTLHGQQLTRLKGGVAIFKAKRLIEGSEVDVLMTKTFVNMLGKE